MRDKFFSIIAFRSNAIYLLLGILFFQISDPSGLSPAQERGKQIYEEGKSSTGAPIIAKVDEIALSATALPCVNCHGQRGIGNPEGGIVPANLQWSYLTNTYDIEFANGRMRSSYSEESLAHAITAGIDPSDNQLHIAMPRYEMSPDQMNDLIEYIKVIHEFKDAGVFEDRIHIGVTLTAVNAQPVKEVLTAYFNWMNDRGGIYNRKVIPFFFSTDSEKKSMEDFIKTNEIFAFVASGFGSSTNEDLAMIKEQNIPIVGALSGSPSLSEIDDPHYYLFPDAPMLAMDLVLHVEKKLDQEPAIIIYDASSKSADIVQFIKDKLNANSLSKFHFLEFQDLQSNRNLILERNAASYISLLPIAQLNEVSDHKILKKSESTIFIPGYLISEDIFNFHTAWQNQIIISLPSWKTQHKEYALKSYQNLLSAYDLKPNKSTSQIHALAAAQLFVEILKRSGREISRLELIEEIENLVGFNTGLMPPLTFSPVDKIGSGRIFTISPELEKRELKLLASRPLLTIQSR